MQKYAVCGSLFPLPSCGTSSLRVSERSLLPVWQLRTHLEAMFTAGTDRSKVGRGLGGNNIGPRVGKRAGWGTGNIVLQQRINSIEKPMPDATARGGDATSLCLVDGEAKRSKLAPPIVERHEVAQLNEAIPMAECDQR